MRFFKTQMSLSAWNSFLSSGSNALTSMIPEHVEQGKTLPTSTAEVAAVEDDLTFNMVNKGTAVLVKQTGQPEIAAKLEQDNKADAERRLERKAAGASAKPSAKPQGLAPRTRVQKKKEEVVKAVAEAHSTVPALCAGTVEKVILPRTSLQPLPIYSLEQYTRREQEADAFTVPVTVQRTQDRVTTQQIINLPPETEVFKYVATNFRDEAKWYDQQIKYVANNPDLTFQKVPIMSRAMIETFLRVPDPKVAWERPCCNLDRDPFPHETGIRCIAHFMAGYRLREMHMNDTIVKVNAALQNKQNPMIYLSPVPEMCVLCHVYLTTHAALCPDKSDSICNRFCVDVDKVGEYDSRKMLTEGHIWGNFPMWNKRHYIACRVMPSNLPGFVETNDLLFRLPRVPYQVSLNANASIHSTPSSAEQAALRLCK